MILQELIETLTKLQIVCGGATDTEVLAVGLRITVSVEKVMGEERRVIQHLITVSSCIKNQDNINLVAHANKDGSYDFTTEDGAFDVDMVRRR